MTYQLIHKLDNTDDIPLLRPELLNLCEQQLWTPGNFIQKQEFIKTIFKHKYDISKWIFSKTLDETRIIDALELIQILINVDLSKGDDSYWILDEQFGKNDNIDNYILRVLNEATLSDSTFHHMILKYRKKLGLHYFSFHLKDERMPLDIIDDVIEKVLQQPQLKRRLVMIDEVYRTLFNTAPNFSDKSYEIESILISNNPNIDNKRYVSMISNIASHKKYLLKHLSEEELGMLIMGDIALIKNLNFDLLQFFLQEYKIKCIPDHVVLTILPQINKFTDNEKWELCNIIPNLYSQLDFNSLSLSIITLGE